MEESSGDATTVGQTPINTADQVHALLVQLQATCPPGARCDLDFQLHQGGRMVPEIWIRRAVQAVLQNAFEAVPTGRGHVTMQATETVVTEATQLKVGPPLGAHRYLRLAIADNGPGFGLLARQAIAPKFTTKPGHAGMGLSEAYGVAVSSSGGLDLGDSPEGGAVVTLYFPMRS